MRHIGSIVLSIIFTPVIYLLTGVGMVKLGSNSGEVLAGQGTDWTTVGVGAGAIVVAGALWAILAMVRLSPLGPFIAGLMLVGAQVWALLNLTNLISTFGTSVMGVSHAAEEPLNGPALLMAVAMLATIFSPRRWRGKDKPTLAAAAYPPAYNAGPTYQEPTSTGPAYPVPTSAAPTYPTPESTAPQSTAPEPTAPEPTAPEPTAPIYTTPDYAATPEAIYAEPTYVPTPEATAPLQTTPETAPDAQVSTTEDDDKKSEE